MIAESSVKAVPQVSGEACQAEYSLRIERDLAQLKTTL